MKNDITTIRELLGRFYEAETDEQDEEILKEYFRGDVASELMAYKPQFQFYDVGFDDGKPLSKDFDDKVLNAIKQMDSKPVIKKSHSYMWYAGIAATFLIAVGYFFLSRDTDNFSEQEYTQAVNAFILISEKMDLASGQLQHLGTIKSEFNQFDAFKALENYGKHLTTNRGLYE